MTPIYRSPDRDQTIAIQSLLLNHHIQTSVIETKKSSDTSRNDSVIWYELWLRNLNELGRAKTIITQHEFTVYRTSMSSYRTSVIEQKKRSESIDQAIPPSSSKTSVTDSLHETRSESAGTTQATEKKPLIPSPLVSQPRVPNPFLSKPASDTNAPTSQMMPKHIVPGQFREDLIPINNKRVFKRLGLLLGFSEEQIQQWDKNNKLYRPWDAAELNESVKRLKQKCS